MEQKIGTPIVEIFNELAEIHESLGIGLSTLAVLKKGADSPEMAEALGMLGDYLYSQFIDLGSLAEIGKRSVVGP